MKGTHMNHDFISDEIINNLTEDEAR